ncbi:GntR family transcriptional regulator [Nocardioides sp. SYSU D00038]|uniref:GntR family transcriptional regulator n=1 Tax=Nocardioides sp. SYSU D00038 TaxID=2812554 RepID=UPI001967D7BC|nr:GntR family transcriptional regulator [Nocardioides sp. SYSU D00038]
MSGTRTPTRSVHVHREVRRAILGGVLRPGSRLSPLALAEQYGVSLGVVREALTRLGEQGLVLSQPQQGFQVLPLSREDLLDLTSVRLDLEPLALRRSVERGTVEWRSQLIAAHHVLERTPEHDLGPDASCVVNEEWAVAHRAFHLQLLAGCGSRRLVEIATTLRDAAEVYRRWSTPLASEPRDVAGEHRAILQAVVEDGDPELAASRLAHHIAHTTDVLIEHAN